MKNLLPNCFDPECQHLCMILNSLPGIKTVCSYGGEGQYPYRIWFLITDVKAPGPAIIARCLCERYHSLNRDWTMKLDHGDLHPVMFLLEGPIAGRYEAAEKLADKLSYYTYPENRWIFFENNP